MEPTHWLPGFPLIRGSLYADAVGIGVCPQFLKPLGIPVTATGFHHRWNVGPIGKHLMGLSDGLSGVKRQAVPAR